SEKDKLLKGSDAWIKKQKEENKLLQEQLKIYKQQEKDLQNQIATGKYKVYGKQNADNVTQSASIAIDKYLKGKIEGINEVLAQRLAQLAKDKGKTIEITSGYRSIEQQQALWEKSDKTGKMVAKPGSSAHNHRIAVDVAGWIQNLSDAE